MLLAMPALAAFQTAYAGRVASVWEGQISHVRDADTIEVTDRRGRTIAVRLSGVDAPELDESGGRDGMNWMQRNFAGKPVRCELDGTKTHDRLVGTCFGTDGTDISAAVIAAGWAQDCPRYSRSVRKGGYSEFNTPKGKSRPLKSYCIPR